MARDPDGQHQRAYLPSLLDRLQDDAPHARHESPAAYAPNGEGMRRIIRRDLASLLNATNLDGELDAGRYPQAAASVVNYGLPPLSGSYLSDRNWETVEKTRSYRDRPVRTAPAARVDCDPARRRPRGGQLQPADVRDSRVDAMVAVSARIQDPEHVRHRIEQGSARSGHAPPTLTWIPDFSTTTTAN